MGSGTRVANMRRENLMRFNPFQGLMGSGTIRDAGSWCGPAQFQSLPGINGVWHFRFFAIGLLAPITFQSLPGINGVWHKAYARGQELRGQVSIPSRD